MLALRKKSNPVDYRLCNQTVTIYHHDKATDKYTRTVIEHGAFLDGDVQVLSAPDDPFMIFTRSLKGEKWAVICNFERGRQIALPFACEKPALANLNRESADGAYAPYECAVAKIKFSAGFTAG